MEHQNTNWFAHAAGICGLLCLLAMFGVFIVANSGWNAPEYLVLIVPLAAIISLVAGIVALAIGRGRLARTEGMAAIVAGVIGFLFIGCVLLYVLITAAISYA